MESRTLQIVIKSTKIVFYILFLVLFISCNNSELKSQNIKSGFLYDAGVYTVPGKNRNILIKELKDGAKIFAIRDLNNKILFQQSLNETFSAYHYWLLYIDIDANVWFYNSDYISHQAILFNKKIQQYEIKDFCKLKLQLLSEFKKEMEANSSKVCVFNKYNFRCF